MKLMLAIARYTFHEAVRNKILYSILFFGIALIFLGTAVGAASLSQDDRILKNVGLFAASFFSDVIAIFVGVTMTFRELERKSIYTILSKPVARWQYFLGKYAGIAFLLLVQLLLMGALLTTIILIRGDTLPAAWWWGLWLTWIEALIVAAVAVFFASFSTPYVSGFLTLGVWLVGRLIQELAGYLPRLEGFVHTLLSGVVAVTPDFSVLTLSTQIVHRIPVTWEYGVHATLYGVGYVVIFLVGGAAIFNRRDFI